MVEAKTELQRNFIADIRKKELDIYQRALDIQWMNNRMEDGRMGRCLALIQQEAGMEKDFQERTDHAAIVNARAKRETALGMEIAKVQNEEAVAYQRRHFLRENNPELKTLARKLEAGYVCRDLQQQMLHNKWRKLQEEAEDRKANEVLDQGLYSVKEQDKMEERRKIEACSKYGQELRQQLVNKQVEKQCQYEDTLIEKKMLDDILKTISDEDKRELQQKKDQMEKMRHEMMTFKMAKEAWRIKQKEMVIKEEKEIERQRQALSDRDATVIAKRMQRLADKEAINQKIVAKIMSDQDARQKRDGLIALLQEQEHLEKNFQDDKAEREKMDRTKKETKEALTKQMEEKSERLRKEKERESDFRIQATLRMKADEEKERKKQVMVKEKNKNHCAQLLRQIEDHHRRQQEYKTDDRARAKYVKAYDAALQAEVAEERKKIMKEHVPGLLGYLQSGVVLKEDLPAVAEGARATPEYAHLKVESLAQKKRRKTFDKCNAQCLILREY